MSPSAPTVGILVTVSPETPEFNTFLKIAGQRLAAGQKVYTYLLHDAVTGIKDSRLQLLKDQGLTLHACALAATRREIPNSESAVFSGLVALGELMNRCDQFLTFSPGAAK